MHKQLCAGHHSFEIFKACNQYIDQFIKCIDSYYTNGDPVDIADQQLYIVQQPLFHVTMFLSITFI